MLQPRPAPPPVIGTTEWLGRARRAGYYATKRLAFAQHRASAPLWQQLPQRLSSFLDGPIVEDYFHATFAGVTRVIKTITLAEYVLEKELLGSDAFGSPHIQLVHSADIVKVVSQLADGGNLAANAAHGNLTVTLSVVRDRGEAYPADAIALAISLGAPAVRVSYTFDFDLFYPLVPLFIPWERVSIALWNAKTSPGGSVQELVDRIEASLAPALDAAMTCDAVFVTVVQRAAGLVLPAITTTSRIANLALRTIVLGAGGGGDVHLPLLATVLQPLERGWRLPIAPPASQIQNGSQGAGAESFLDMDVDRLSVRPLGYELNFVGTIRGGVNVRTLIMSQMLRTLTPGTFSIAAVAPHIVANTGRPLWQLVMGDAALTLAPRGTNPTSFRLFEALQAGVTPVYVYTDEDERPVLPYFDYAAPGVLDERGRLTSVAVADGGWMRKSPHQSQQPVAPPASSLRGTRSGGAHDVPAMAVHAAASPLPPPPPPPQRLWHRTAIVVPVARFGDFLEAVPHLAANVTWRKAKRDYALAATEAYFTYEAVMRHLFWLLSDLDGAELKCARAPQRYFFPPPE